jgi:ERCC4-type nuclease
MRIIIDEREHAVYTKCVEFLQTNPKYASVQLMKKVLHLGDILIQTDDESELLLVERKTFSDLLSSIKDGRYAEQSHRLTYSSGYPHHSIIYLIEGVLSQVQNAADKQKILSTMTSVNVFKGFSVHRTSTVTESAEWVIQLAYKIGAEIGKGNVPYWKREAIVPSVPSQDGASQEPAEAAPSSACPPPHYSSVVKKVKKENITPDNIGEILLCQIPSISTTTASAIMKRFTSFSHFMEELKKNPACIDGITCESKGKTRKISKACLENIKSYLVVQEPLPAPEA